MTAAEIVERIQECGGDVLLMPDRRLCIEQRSQVPDALAQSAKNHADEIRALLAARVTIASTCLIREGRWPPPPTLAMPVCEFHIGRAGDPCRRCGNDWDTHHYVTEKISPSVRC